MIPLQLLCWNTVRDYTRWRARFDGDLERAARAGLELRAVWRSVDAPETIHFLFDVQDRARAEAFMADPESVRSGVAAGVLDGGAVFVRSVSPRGGTP